MYFFKKSKCNSCCDTNNRVFDFLQRRTSIQPHQEEQPIIWRYYNYWECPTATHHTPWKPTTTRRTTSYMEIILLLASLTISSSAVFHVGILYPLYKGFLIPIVMGESHFTTSYHHEELPCLSPRRNIVYMEIL